MTAYRVALIGWGTVGGGVLELLQRDRTLLAERCGLDIRISRIVTREPSRPRNQSAGEASLGSDIAAVLDDPEIHAVLHLVGGTGAARELALACLRAGKHLITANKALLAEHWDELFREASRHGASIAFEAAVAGGIPIIKAIREGLAGNRIEWLAGIINGTGNFILTEMRDKGRTFDDVLAEAQALGYAEADPAFDVEGTDAAHKLCILAAIAFGTPLEFDKVFTEGITRVTPEDVHYAGLLGYVIKHLGIARRREDGVEMRVHPTLIPRQRLIASVDGVMNAVLVRADAVGPTLYYGAGAGAEPTASAVVADLVDVVRTLTSDPENRVPHLAFQPGALSDLPALPIEQCESAYYLRMMAADRPGVLAEIATVLGDAGISIEAVVQPEPPRGSPQAKLVMLTHTVRERQMNEALARVATLDTVAGEVVRIRVEHLEGD
jgi:homoserine dehydrogenase